MLACIARDPGVCQAELARQVMVTPQSVSESLAALQDGGWIARDKVEPGRAAKLRLTTEGRKLLQKPYPVLEASNQEFFALLTGGERTELARILQKIIG